MESSQEPVPKTTDRPTSSQATEMQQTSVQPAASVVSPELDTLEESLPFISSRASQLVNVTAGTVGPSCPTTDRDSTDRRLTLNLTSRGPQGVDPAPCPATPVVVWPAGPRLTPRGQGHFSNYATAVEGGPASCGANTLLQAGDTMRTHGE